MKRGVAYAGAAAAVLTLALALAARVTIFPAGLAATYSTVSAASPGQPRAFSRIDLPPLSTALVAAWNGAPPDSFNVIWTGQITAPRRGRYTLAVNADSGTAFFIDGRSVFDNISHPDDQFASATANLAAGPHTVFLEYAHRGGTPRLDLLWSVDGGVLATIPSSALQPRAEGPLRVRVGLILDGASVLLGWLLAVELAALAILAFGAAAWATLRVLMRRDLWRELRWILAGSLLLNVTGVWWGLPAAWVPIELTPTFVFDFIVHRFSNGWFDAYPPLQYYVLSSAISPFLALQHFAGVTVDGVVGHTAMVLVFRLISVMAAAGMVACACLAGADAFGKRAGLLAAAALALTTPFVFYAKTANVDVPYLFWFSLSVVVYLRLMRELRLGDFILFAAAATCAVCTKDQAYGFYVLVPLAVIERVWAENRRRALPNPFAAVFRDRRILAAVGTAVLLFALFHNLVFNLDGFKQHIAFITGHGSEDYRVYEPTLAGRWTLLKLTVRLIQISMGWPMFVAGVAGLMLAVATGATRSTALWLLVPIVSYYIFFIDVVLYNYDRFVMPMCFVLAIFGGLALDRLVNFRPLRAVAAGAVAIAFAYTLLYAGTVDVLMVRDSRYDAQRWMHAHVGDALVGVSELPEVLPGLAPFRTIGMATVEELKREAPRFFVLNADYARAAESGSPWAQLVDGLQKEAVGYRAVAHFRASAPWPWLPAAHPDLVGSRQGAVVFSVLRDINPTIDIYERQP